MLYINNQDLESNQESRVQTATATAVLDEQRRQQEICTERVNSPHLQFIGPTDLGRLVFNFPRTWNMYIHQDGLNNTNFEAFLHPGSVAAIRPNNIYALRVSILRQEYTTVLQRYDGLVRANLLRTSPFQHGEIVGMRFDGEFAPEIRGSQVVIRVRDRTVILRTDSETFRPDFDQIIRTIELNL